MKKVLFATTALIATAGVASADIALSGVANFGIATDGDGLNSLTPPAAYGRTAGKAYSYAEAELDIVFSGETDSGLSFGAKIDINVGNGFDLGDGEFDNNSGTPSLGNVFISGAFGKLTFDTNGGIDDLYNDDNKHDMSYAYSAGGISATVTYDVDGNNASNPLLGSGSQVSFAFGYSADGLSASYTGNDVDGGKINASYAIDDTITASLEHDMPDGVDAVTELGVEYSANGISLSAAADTADGWGLGFGLEMGDISVGLSTDDASAWEATFSYALGTGVSLDGGVNAAEDSFVGVSLKF